MALKFYNTLTREKEEFKPIKEREVGLYTCGPTVYDYAHIGNYRAYIFGDILKRYLQYKGYNVKHVMNITDVDDKTIKKSIDEDKNLSEITEFYTKEFFKDCDNLNIIPANVYTKATSFIKEMEDIIQSLINKGYAYKGDDGSIYFDIHKDKEYGKLSHFKLTDLKENAKGRLKSDEYEKENAEDFALWKAWDSNDGEIYWDSSFGRGRPGWHIECSAMSIHELGESFDIHTGGIDNMFPHHENEIAQSECASGKPFVKYWMHNEHLMVDGKKMSKSLGNFYTLRDLVDKGINPLAFRYWLYTGHYRTKVNFTLEAISGAEVALHKLYNIYKNLGLETSKTKIDVNYVNRFNESMDDDLNTPQAIAVVWELIKDENIPNIVKKSTLQYFDQVLGFGLNNIKEDIVSDEVTKLAKERLTARQNKDWQKSDELREKIKSLGYEVKDIDSGYEINKI